MTAHQKPVVTLVIFLTLVGLAVVLSRGLVTISLFNGASSGKQASTSAKVAPDLGYNEVGTITYDGTNFSPASVTAKVDTVLAASASASPQDKSWLKIINNSKDIINIVSANSELNSIGIISGGGEFKIVQLSKLGTFTYHDKTHTDRGGTVIVQAK